MITLFHFLVVGALLFVIGIYGTLTRRNAIGILMSLELVLNAANINFVAFSRLYPVPVEGHIFALFVITLAAAEAAVGLAIVLAIYRNARHIYLDQINLMKW